MSNKQANKQTNKHFRCDVWWLFSHVQLFVTPWTIQSMEFSRPEYWRIQPFRIQPFTSPGGFSQPRDWTQVSGIARRLFTSWATENHWMLTPIHPSDHSSIDIFNTFILRFYIFRKCGFGRGTDTKPMEQIREPRKKIIQKAHLIFNKDIKVIEWMKLIFWQLELEQVDIHR